MLLINDSDNNGRCYVMVVNSNRIGVPYNRTVGRGVFCAVRAELYNEEQLRLQEGLETAGRRVGGWCEMTAGQKGREHGS
jgi:hypothetical protein